MDVDEAHINNTEINNITDTIAGGAENRLRRDEEEEKFSRRAAIGMMPYTGCAKKFMSNIKYWDRSVYLDCKEAVFNAQAEIEAGVDEDKDDEADEQL